MARVVGVHGIGQQREGTETLNAAWGPAIRSGIALADGSLPADQLACAFYGHLFRPPGQLLAAGDPHLRPADVTDDEAELLAMLWRHAAEIEPDRVPPPDAELLFATPKSVQAALRVLSRSRFFARISERAMIGSLKQVRQYLGDQGVRQAAQEAVADEVTADTTVIVAHSLGSVVAYEALHTYAEDPRWANVTTFVTLGSPLGIPNLIFDQLRPAPTNGRGSWPPGIDAWTNVSDAGDVVALTKRLAPLFRGVASDSGDGGPDGDPSGSGGEDAPGIVDVGISNGATAHSVLPYLTARETGEAILHGLD